MRIYLQDKKQIIEYSRGTGDNLLPEDREEGYVDYINYTIYDLDDLDDVKEIDGGLVLLTEPYNEAEAEKQVLCEAGETSTCKYIVLEVADKTNTQDAFKKGYDDGAYESQLLFQQELEAEVAAAFDRGYDEGYAAATAKMDEVEG